MAAVSLYLSDEVAQRLRHLANAHTQGSVSRAVTLLVNTAYSPETAKVPVPPPDAWRMPPRSRRVEPVLSAVAYGQGLARRSPELLPHACDMTALNALELHLRRWVRTGAPFPEQRAAVWVGWLLALGATEADLEAIGEL